MRSKTRCNECNLDLEISDETMCGQYSVTVNGKRTTVKRGIALYKDDDVHKWLESEKIGQEACRWGLAQRIAKATHYHPPDMSVFDQSKNT